MEKNINYYCELANKVLDNNTGYYLSKKIIKNVFSIKGEDYNETVRMRLTLIDSYYSTNMNKRYYGVEDISSMISTYYSDDKLFIGDLLLFINDSLFNDPLSKIFDSCYGIDKIGCTKGRAKSLISKYCYFLMDCNFPIYDTIVFESYPLIINKFSINGLNSKLSKRIPDFTNSMKQLKDVAGVNGFNKLDNLLWLIGKIRRGNLSLILTKEKYKNLIDEIKLEDSKTNLNKVIKKYLYAYIESPKTTLDKDLHDMILFTKSLDTISVV